MFQFMGDHPILTFFVVLMVCQTIIISVRGYARDRDDK